MSRAELLALPGMLAKQAPLNASQRALLHEVVVHVFLATEPYASDASKGFLGVNHIAAVHVALPDSESGRPHAGDDEVPMGNVDSLIDPNEGSPDTGIIVSECMPGFCGYRVFENGDVILAAREGEMVPIHSVERLRDLVQAHHAGEQMTFQVLRRGKIIEVELRVDGLPEVARPAMVAPAALDAFLNGRARRRSNSGMSILRLWLGRTFRDDAQGTGSRKYLQESWGFLLTCGRLANLI